MNCPHCGEPIESPLATFDYPSAALTSAASCPPPLVVDPNVNVAGPIVVKGEVGLEFHAPGCAPQFNGFVLSVPVGGSDE